MYLFGEMRVHIISLVFFCSALLSAQQELDALLFQKGDFKIYTNKAGHPENVLYNTWDDVKGLMTTNSGNGVDCSLGIKIGYNPLSLVGNYYSYERNLFDPGATGDCYRNPSSEAEVNTVDIVTGKKTSLLELVDEESLVIALKNDLWVQDMYGTMDVVELDGKKTFQEILSLINSNMGFGIKFEPDSFALLSYDPETKLLAIRLIGIKYMGYDHSRHIQLGLYVRPKDYLKRELEKEEGFFLGKFKNGLL